MQRRRFECLETYCSSSDLMQALFGIFTANNVHVNLLLEGL